MLNAPIDLGGGVSIRTMICECSDPECDKATPCGLYWDHDRPDGTHCEGSSHSYVPLHGPGAWRVESLEPLTLSPSLLCTQCKTHGFIREGKWVSA
jgi:hypothetical protein